MSSKTPITFGAPQGSILGPLLFIIHMNDLPLHLNESYIDLFADDATQYTTSGTIQGVEDKINADIQTNSALDHCWNKMILNETKNDDYSLNEN